MKPNQSMPHSETNAQRYKPRWSPEEAASYRRHLFSIWEDPDFGKKLNKNFQTHMTGSIKRPKPYPYVAQFMMTLRFLCRIKSKAGGLVYINSIRINPDEYLITSRKALMEATRRFGVQLSEKQIRTCMKLLKQNKVIHALHGQSKSCRSVIYLRFNLNILQKYLDSPASRVSVHPDSGPVQVVDVDMRTPKNVYNSPRQSYRSIMNLEPKTGPTTIYRYHCPVASMNADVQEKVVGRIKNESLTEGDTAVPEKTKAFELSEDQHQIVDFIRSNPIFQDENRVHNPVQIITASQMNKILQLTREPDGLTLGFLKSFFGAVSGTEAEFHVEADRFYQTCNLDFFLKTFHTIKRELPKDQRKSIEIDIQADEKLLAACNFVLECAEMMRSKIQGNALSAVTLPMEKSRFYDPGQYETIVLLLLDKLMDTEFPFLFDHCATRSQAQGYLLAQPHVLFGLPHKTGQPLEHFCGLFGIEDLGPFEESYREVVVFNETRGIRCPFPATTD